MDKSKILREMVNYERSNDLIIEFSEDKQRAIVKYPLMHVGPNLKNLYWRPDVLEKVAAMFNGVPFKYDLRGEKGSSHTPDNVFSPFYDVGWTYEQKGSWYDSNNQTLWVKGEITHPEVVEKLKRINSEGKREINYASMGVFIDPETAYCSVCGKRWGDCEHVRGEQYGNNICYIVPMDIKKALHVALTNDPADTESELAEVVFQEEGIMDMMNQNVPVNPEAFQAIVERVKTLESEQEKIKGENMPDEQKTIGQPVQPQQQTAQAQQQPLQRPAQQPQQETAQNQQQPQAQQQQPVQQQTAQQQQPQQQEQLQQAQQEVVAQPQVDVSLADVMAVLQQIVQKLGGTEMADGTAQTDDPTGREVPVPPAEKGVEEESLQKVGEAAEVDPGNAKNEEVMDNPEKYETADANKIIEKYRQKIILEVADHSLRLGKHTEKEKSLAEFADRSIEQLELLNATLSNVPTPIKGQAHFADAVPEFGGAQPQNQVMEIADMSAAQRREEFGEFGGFDVCFNPQNAPRYKKEKVN